MPPLGPIDRGPASEAILSTFEKPLKAKKTSGFISSIEIPTIKRYTVKTTW
jgi:hypothetical protein